MLHKTYQTRTTLDPEDVCLFGVAAVVSEAREAADTVQLFRHELVSLTGVEEWGYCDRGAQRREKWCIEAGRGGLECRRGRPRGLYSYNRIRWKGCTPNSDQVEGFST